MALALYYATGTGSYCHRNLCPLGSCARPSGTSYSSVTAGFKGTLNGGDKRRERKGKRERAFPVGGGMAPWLLGG